MYVETKRVEFLDSVRGIPALFVLLAHTAGAFAWPPGYGTISHLPLLAILFDGKEAVCMFFVLSGYVLSKPYLPAAGNPAAPRRIFLPTFYVRRLTRIWLPWFAVFLLSLLARRYWFHLPVTDPPASTWLAGLWQGAMTPGEFFRQCAFLEHDAGRQLLNQDWSLGVELKGSFLMPLLVFLLLTRRPVIWLLLLAVLFTFGLGSGYFYVSFLLGAWLARLGESVVAQPIGSNRYIRGIFLALGLALYQTWGWLTGAFPSTRWATECGWITTSLGCVLVLLSIFRSQTAQTWLSARPMVFLGRISYSVYLLQFIIILCLLPPLVRLANAAGLHQGPVLFVLVLLASMGATVGCGALSYRILEVPAINLGHAATRKIQEYFQP